MSRGEMLCDTFQFMERCRQEIAIFCHAMDPAKLLCAGEKRFQPIECHSYPVDQFSHARRAHATTSKRRLHTLPDGGFRRRRLYPMAGKMNDNTPAGKDTVLT